ncbi:lipoyl(octanoyl) transferase [Sphingobium wenxiniae]|uniref:Octanoyltransferase n=1 Tax=Sphingobium wenxiniae (strain DSM 21828 / CGMCC 1.7748 / JZ-1) TaxID=595605 RepID=A0A562K4K7_SPHWJ|nr:MULTISPECIES: lipoyl(octanoyl) transferase LipB [Sphingobium]MBB6193053.1 lipoyl(octanoyl) transferase [Sphingobium wenxiniae]TWH90381.1 lipoyl(octanoyl) transferase [Sphingobium wenxiniae]WRD76409.1 lipoyl(octanoyl) transferase LipB [Sphingobium baderi]
MTALPPSPSASDAADMVEWRVESAPVDYPEALADMEARAAAIFAGEAKERVWLLQHPPLYTAGTSADPAELLDPRFPVHAAGRGGRYTYHGPGQRIGYLNIDLRERGRDVRNFVHHLEGWMIAALGDLGIAARRAEGRIGIWTDDAQGREAKIGALGIRVRRWITLHGFSINVDPDLSHFGGIVPCGISAYPVTSMAALGCTARMAELDAALRAHFPAFLARLGRCGAGVEQCETGR